MTPMRRTIARNLTASAQQIPQFTSMVDFDASSLLLQRAALRDQVDGPMPLDAVLMQVLVETLQDHPLMNAQLLGNEIEYFDAFDIGVAVDTADGLMVPVVSGADALDAEQLGAEIARLAIAARERTIRPEELTGGTCTLNNVGALGILYGTPILPLNTSTIVAIGAARKTVQLRDGQPVELPIVTISGTFDHRLIDGGGSARFLKDLKDRFEALSA
jgi:pyruvate/2-oxoglutarate dehydrogenase complex dihydrolipoamide acyltransferase (E2) component